MKNRNRRAIVISLLILVILLCAYFIYTIAKSGLSDGLTSTLPSVDPAKSFTVVVLPDTQNYSSTYPEIFCKQTQWIVDHKKDLNIVFVSQLGDIVNDGAQKMYEWENASRCLGKLDGVVPYGLVPGNHDADIPSDKASGFSAYDKYFPVTRFNGNPWYGGNFSNNRNNYEVVTISDALGKLSPVSQASFSVETVKDKSANQKTSLKKIMFLNLEIEPSNEALAWADSVVKKNPDAYTILTTHKYLPVDSLTRDHVLNFSKDGNTGEQIWQKLIKDNCSIAMVWSGHFHGENQIASKNACGGKVYQILQDYQDFPNGGNGWLRVYVFSPEKKRVQVFTLSPFLDKMRKGASSQFPIPLNMR